MASRKASIGALVLAVIAGVAAYTQFTPNQSDTPTQARSSWTAVQDYIDADDAWHKALEVVRASDLPEDQKEIQFDEVREARPDAEAAVTAALSIVQSGQLQDETINAAHFLVEKTSGSKRRSEAILAGMMAIAEYQPDYDEWSKALLIADVLTPPGVLTELDQFIEQFDKHVEKPQMAIATARYYAASRRIMLANWVKDSDSELDRSEHRRLAIEFATGLSEGVEDIKLVKRQAPGPDGKPLPYPTFAQVERDLLFALNFLTVGGKVPDASANTMAGIDDTLLNYRGRTVLLDFWATWCAPCIEALPKLDKLKLELPGQFFEVISINSDETLDTLIEFEEGRPMDWVHWYIGEDAELLKAWAIRGFPTYMLIDRDGVLVAKQHDLNDTFLDLVKQTTYSSAASKTPGLLKLKACNKQPGG